MIKSVLHIALMTTDAEKTAEFYIDKLGFKETGRLTVPGAGNLIFLGLDENQVQLEIFSNGNAFPEGKSPWGDQEVGYKHICLLVDDVRKETARLKELGVEFYLEPSEVAGLCISFFKDPDGNVIELLQKFS